MAVLTNITKIVEDAAKNILQYISRKPMTLVTGMKA